MRLENKLFTKRALMFYILISIVFYLLGALTVRYQLFPYPQVLRLKNKLPMDKSSKYLNNRTVRLYKIYATKNVDIVMLGDSLTHRVDWSELFDMQIINRGVDGDITDGYLHRMDFIYKVNPKKVFINGGTNDFIAGYTVDEVFENYKLLIDLLQEHNIKPYIQSVVFTSFDDINTKINRLNSALKNYCAEIGVEYIDLNENLSKNNKLLDKYTVDGSHLNAEGYEVWRDTIKGYLQ